MTSDKTFNAGISPILNVTYSDYGSEPDNEARNVMNEFSSESENLNSLDQSYENTVDRILKEITYKSIYDTVFPEFDENIFMRSLIQKYKTE